MVMPPPPSLLVEVKDAEEDTPDHRLTPLSLSLPWPTLVLLLLSLGLTLTLLASFVPALLSWLMLALLLSRWLTLALLLLLASCSVLCSSQLRGE